MIRRLYIENYKLFDRKEILFSNAKLFVLDGPNGYGKTSLFDAIELLVKGRIGRVDDCKSIDGTLSYDSVFLAKDPNKDVIVKAEFIDSQGQVFALGTKIEPRTPGRENNPKSMMKKILFYDLPSYDEGSENIWGNPIINIDKYRKEKFGDYTSEMFDILHYVSQEDRLAYFNQTEAKRSEVIESLIDVGRYNKEITIAEQRLHLLNNMKKNAEAQLKLMNSVSEPKTLPKTAQYHKLLSVDVPWDREFVPFSSDDPQKSFTLYSSELEKIEKYYQFKEYHELFCALEKYNAVLNNKKPYAVKAWLLCKGNDEWKKTIQEEQYKLDFCKTQIDKYEKGEFLEIDYNELFKLLTIEKSSELITSIQQLRQLYKTQKGYSNAYSNLIDIRDKLHAEYTSIESTGVCPYCGYDWTNTIELEKQFDSVKEEFSKNLEDSHVLFINQREIVKKDFENEILDALKKMIEEKQTSPLLQVFNKFESEKEFYECLDGIDSILKFVLEGKADEFGNGSIDSKVAALIERCEQMKELIPKQYFMDNATCDFTHLQELYNLNIIIDKITHNDFAEKRDYLRGQYLDFIVRRNKEKQVLTYNVEKLKKIIDQVTLYKEAYINAAKRRKQDIVDRIGILFYIYSSRLLLSHQGGGGILIKANEDLSQERGTGKRKDIVDNQLRFTSRGKEHDVYYTMSSGQMSAIILAFSLAMHKIYADKKMNMVFIDDPIQCMDDINMVSFVELLRTTFNNTQMIISTHEKNFSNYIRYKFEKAGIETKSLSLKDT